jgi:UPF0271 protein
MDPAAIASMVAAQVGALQGVASLAGVEVAYVKPHGALANLAADDAEVARAIAGVARAMALPVLAISGTALELACRRAEVRVFPEVFADRTYLPNGRLVPRSREGAVIHDAEEAVERMLAFLRTQEMPCLEGGSVRLEAASICVHSDTAGAVAMAQALRRRLMAEGVVVAPFLG